MKKLIALLALVVMVLFAVAAECTALEEEATPAGSGGGRTAAPKQTRTPIPPKYKLALISSSCLWNENTGYFTCEGFVENITNEPMENIEAVINWYDESDTPITSESALIEYDPVLPGQQSPWKVMGRYNPAMDKYRVEFKEFFGGTIGTEDRR